MSIRDANVLGVFRSRNDAVRFVNEAVNLALRHRFSRRCGIIFQRQRSDMMFCELISAIESALDRAIEVVAGTTTMDMRNLCGFCV